MMKLSDWARKNNIAYITAYRWYKNNTLPVKATQMPTGTIMVHEENGNVKPKRVVIYARVSNQSRRKELDYQVERIVNFCTAKGLEIDKIYKEVASGMNDSRRELWKMLNSEPTSIVIEHKDRLTRFGFTYLENLLKKQNCEILIMNKDTEDESDLMKDLVSIITSFCCRLYGMRRGMNKKKKLEAVLNDTND